MKITKKILSIITLSGIFFNLSVGTVTAYDYGFSFDLARGESGFSGIGIKRNNNPGYASVAVDNTNASQSGPLFLCVYTSDKSNRVSQSTQVYGSGNFNISYYGAQTNEFQGRLKGNAGYYSTWASGTWTP